jgi:iron(III) transport system ATP-binding protein
MESPLTLFDEPLSNLDAKLRDGMRFELKRLQRELQITAIYVTHDQVEALAMSTTIAVLKVGSLEQIGRPRDIYEAPASLFVADFIGTSNFIAGKITGQEGTGVFRVETAVGEVLAMVTSDRPLTAGTDVTVSVRPQDVGMVKEPAAVRGVGRWPGIVRAREYLGEYVDHFVEVGEGTNVRVRTGARNTLGPDTEVVLSLEPGHSTLLPQQ